MGYAGGTSRNPTYYRMGDHSESIQIVYDPSVISYNDLLNIFWEEHDPFSRTWSRQYMNVVFYENDRQKDAIERSVSNLESKGNKVKTRIAYLDSFTPAEDYHQKHALQRYPEFVHELSNQAPDGQWMFSTPAARINGYLGGSGTCGALEKEVGNFGLSPAREEQLLRIVCSREGRRSMACPLPASK